MKKINHIVGIRIQDEEIGLCKLSTGVIKYPEEIETDIGLRDMKYTIRTNNIIDEIKISKDGNRIIGPSIKKLSKINILEEKDEYEY